jgi:YVTN family beta-propeller protein
MRRRCSTTTRARRRSTRPGARAAPPAPTLFVANNLADTLGIVEDLRSRRLLTRVALHGGREPRDLYPYDVKVTPDAEGARAAKAYVSLWSDATVAVVDAGARRLKRRIAVGRHPTAMQLNREASRLFVVNTGDDSVSVIDTTSDEEIERIAVRLTERALPGNSPQGLALSDDERTLFVANAQSDSVAVVSLSDRARGTTGGAPEAHGGLETSGPDVDGPVQVSDTPAGRSAAGTEELHEAQARPGRGEEEDAAEEDDEEDDEQEGVRSVVRGFIPTGRYPSAVAVAAGVIYVGNGKGTGFLPSSVVVSHEGHSPNTPTDRFPAAAGRGGQYIVSLIAGNLSAVSMPDDRQLADYTQDVLRLNGLLGSRRERLFSGASPITHVIYVIKENRTYDQVFGDVGASGDGTRADGDPSLAIFGAGEAARRPGGPPQDVSPNHRALALRFGLLDRFFVNSEASPDGHNWSTAAFSSDFVDKSFRWQYSGRGRTYDYEGFNRLPSYEPPGHLPQVFPLPANGDDLAAYMRQFVPYLHGGRDAAEPATLYLWDAAARAGLRHRNYGEFVGTISENDVAAINAGRRKAYPDVSRIVRTVPTKASLEAHHSPSFRAYDLWTPDAMSTESYRAAAESSGRIDPVIRPDHPDARFRGSTRLSAWLDEFAAYVADLEAGRPDRLPHLTVMRFPNDHTAGTSAGMPTPQFYMAENDYAVGRLVEAVSQSPYWRDTAIFVLEDDAQDGPDHVDAHRSPALVVSAYNRRGALVHEYHNTVSLIRTIELLLGIAPMNQLDAMAVPIDLFQPEPDLTPYRAVLPTVALDNLLNPVARGRAAAYWQRRTAEQNLAQADMADPGVLNGAIWFSVRGPERPMPAAVCLPAFDAMRLGLARAGEEEAERQGRRLARVARALSAPRAH